MRHYPLIVTLTLGFLVGCESLPELARDVCGNHVIEKNEDCDGAGIGENTCNENCRLTCTAELQCPEGWGCGIDGLCRQPSGFVEFFGGALALPGDSLSLADFDGDGRSDVLAAQDSTVTLAYVDSGGLLPNTRSLSFEPIDEFPDLPGLGDLDGDGTADLAVRVGEGVAVLQGSEDKTLLPSPFIRALPEGYEAGDQLLLANIDRRSDAVGDELLAIRSDGLYLLQTLAEDFPTLPVRMFAWSEGEAPFVTVVRAGEFGFAGDALLVAFPGGNSVTLFEPFVFEYDVKTGVASILPNFEDTPVRPPVVVSLPAGATVTGPVLTGHFNWDFEDDSFDLFIPGELGGEPAEFLSFRTGLGFSSVPFLNVVPIADNAARRFLRTIDGLPVESSPFAIGQFDFDTLSDFVDADGIVASGCNLQLGGCLIGYALGPDDPLTADYFTVALPEGLDGWTGAYVLVRDTTVLQRGDVLTTSPKSGFTFFRRGEDGFAKFQFSTVSPVTNVDFGDFNGDGARDLVFAQVSTRATPEDPTLQSLAISYGDALGLPTAPVDLGDVGSVEQVAAGRLPDPGAFPNSVDDIFARSDDRYYVFRGSTDKTVVSPLELPLVCPEGSAPRGAARALAVGHFDDRDGADIATIYQEINDQGDYLWQLWSYQPVSNDSEEICTVSTGPTPIEDPGSDELRVLPMDLDADGYDELVILPVGAPQLLIARWDGGEWLLETLPLDEPAYGMAKRDLGIHEGFEVIEDLLLWSDQSLTVLINDGVGSFADPQSAVISGVDCSVRAKGAEAGAPTGATAIRLSGAVERDIVVTTAEDSLLVSVDPLTGSPFVEACVTDILEGGGTAIASGDFDGDGVEDLVVARPGGTRLIAGVPVVR